MDKPLRLKSAAYPRVALRAIGPGDLDDLRAWKNENRKGFFFQGTITPAMQEEWYQAYRGRPDDRMFVVESEGKKAGCLGFRREASGAVDTYNMIAAPGFGGKGLMKAAMAVMCSYAAERFGRDIGCLVVKGNPALKYYESCGYKVVGDGGDHDVLKLDWSRFKPVAYEAEERP